MLNTYIWKVVPSGKPTVIRSCPKCGNHSEYESTDNFRVNANQSLIDVWLIYQCKKCKSTWNMDVLSRVSPKTIEKELYQKFLDNDPELADRYAFDSTSHSRNKSVLSYENLSYEIIGKDISLNSLQENLQLEIQYDYSLDIRLDKILSRQLGISREQVKKLGCSGKITVEGNQDIGKAKLKNGMLLTFHQ